MTGEPAALVPPDGGHWLQPSTAASQEPGGGSEMGDACRAFAEARFAA